MTPTEGQTTTPADDRMRAWVCQWSWRTKISILCFCPRCSTIYREARQENEARNSTTGAKTP